MHRYRWTSIAPYKFLTKQIYKKNNSSQYSLTNNYNVNVFRIIKCLRIFVRQVDMGRDKRIWYLSPMRAAKVQASLRIRAVSPEPSLLAHTSSESRGTFRQKARSLAPLNGWACAVKICHDGMLEDTNSLDVAHIILKYFIATYKYL